jgi:TRAP-type C4-dicarboxylate transport system substrate-binding protein
MIPVRALAAALLVAAVGVAPVAAEPVTLRIATIAPTGSGWAREFSAWARDVESGTHGAVRVKIYFDGVAGDDLAVLDRIRRDQLDGGIGSESCLRLSPSMRVTRVFGLFQSRDESKYILTRLLPRIDAEFLKAGFINMGYAALGAEMLFTRRPVRDFAELAATTLWVWDLDESLRRQAKALGLKFVTAPLDAAARAYDARRVDGFVAVPTAALAFQWSAQASYLSPLNFNFRDGCLFIASRAFDALPVDVQRYVRAASAKLRGRLDDLNRRQDQALLDGLFARQGLKLVPVSERFRVEFYERARELRSRPNGQIVSSQLLTDVLSWLADYRAEHRLPKGGE